MSGIKREYLHMTIHIKYQALFLGENITNMSFGESKRTKEFFFSFFFHSEVFMYFLQKILMGKLYTFWGGNS